MADERPANGVRVVLARELAEGDAARYVVTLAGAEGVFSAATDLRAGQAPALEVEGAPGWMVDSALSFLRLVVRDAARGEAWPPRLTRWRGRPTTPR